MTEFAALVARRLCHDFAGPVGAIATAVELLGSDDDAEVRALIGDSARSLSASLRFYRVILSPADSMVAAHDMRDLLGGWLQGRDGPELDWRVRGGELDGARGSTLLGLALLTAESLPRGGTLRLADDEVVASGARVRLDADVARGLAGDHSNPSPRGALARLIEAHATAAGLGIAVSAGETELAMRLASAGKSR